MKMHACARLLRDKYATTSDDLVSWGRTALPVAIEDLRLRDSV